VLRYDEFSEPELGDGLVARDAEAASTVLRVGGDLDTVYFPLAALAPEEVGETTITRHLNTGV
jgi:hypothetical protein